MAFNPLELDKRFREIAAKVTPETILSSTRELTELGIGPQTACMILLRILEEK